MEIYIAIAMFCIVTSLSPGPNNLMLMSSGLNHGIRKTLPHFFGIYVGFPVLFAAIGLGLGSVFLKYPVFHQILKVAGSSYLLFLAWKIANSGSPDAKETLREPLTFFQAVVFQWVNPKAWAVSIGAIATFTTVGDVGKKILTILVGYMTVGSMCLVLWLLLGASLQRLIQGQKHLRLFNLLMAVLLVVSVITIVFTDFSNDA